MDSPEPADTANDQIYTPAPGETQYTLRAVVVGCLIGGIAGIANLSLGLKTGWSIGASLLTAILAFALFTLLRPQQRFTVLETNISQTCGAAASSMALAGGLMGPIPAMAMLGHEIAPMAVLLWGLAISGLGVFFAVPLRRQYILIEKLRYPSGTATAHTIVSMFATAGEAMAKARVLLYTALGAAVFSLAVYFVPQLEAPPLHAIDGLPGPVAAALATAATWSFSLYLGPSLAGAGLLIGPRVAFSLLAGGLVAWGLLGPVVTHLGWVTGAPLAHDGAQGWILWPGAAIMVGDALVSLALAYKTILRTFQPVSAAEPAQVLADHPDVIPGTWWFLGLAGGSAMTCTIAYLVFDIPVWMSLLAIALSAVLSAIAARTMGETDINPAGPMGKVTQMVFGGVAPGNIPTNLMAAGITMAGASQASEMLQDLKTGHMVGASPRKQLLAQLWGVAAGIALVLPAYVVFDRAYDIGTDPQMPAPGARAWMAVAEVVTEGFHRLPGNAMWAMLGGLLFGALIPVLRKLVPGLTRYMPSGLAFGLAFIVPAFFSISIAAGGLLLVAWQLRSRERAERYVFAVSCGLIAGEGVMNVIKAVMSLLGVPPLT